MTRVAARPLRPLALVMAAAAMAGAAMAAGAGPLQGQGPDDVPLGAILAPGPWPEMVATTPAVPANLFPRSAIARSIPEPTMDSPRASETTETARGRNDAMLNGALISLGALGIADNVVVHWILGWHRAIEGHDHTLEIELAIVAVSAAMLVTGIVRERRARRARRSR